VFVLGTARSGSSVVTAMLGRHPQLFGLPELKLFAYATLAELDASLPASMRRRGIRHRSPGLVRTIAQLEFGDQSPAAAAAALAWLAERAHWTGAELLDHVQARVAPHAVIEKSPETTATPGALERLADAYPRARYVHLTRHPVATARSLKAHWERTTGSRRLDGAEREGLIAWLAVTNRIRRFGAAVAPDRFVSARAEDVLADPGAELARIARRLGLRDDPDAIESMRHPEDSPFARPGPPGLEGGHDRGFLRDPAPRPLAPTPPLVPSPGETIEPELWEQIVVLSARLGYATP